MCKTITWVKPEAVYEYAGIRPMDDDSTVLIGKLGKIPVALITTRSSRQKGKKNKFHLITRLSLDDTQTDESYRIKKLKGMTEFYIKRWIENAGLASKKTKREQGGNS